MRVNIFLMASRKEFLGEHVFSHGADLLRALELHRPGGRHSVAAQAIATGWGNPNVASSTISQAHGGQRQQHHTHCATLWQPYTLARIFL
jgi:hypothetical protein